VIKGTSYVALDDSKNSSPEDSRRWPDEGSRLTTYPPLDSMPSILLTYVARMNQLARSGPFRSFGLLDIEGLYFSRR
jgi:hypothetical protein